MNILTWNIANWITVVIMVALGFIAFSVTSAIFTGSLGQDSDEDENEAGAGYEAY